ncbi:Rab proteins geranylgeranyltransferase component A [Leucoagaricus sp. SymC.cos]|nr:Rab proteins geranylgeranyltransferase component A [Leucoagaricus sp. SymC.cos]
MENSNFDVIILGTGLTESIVAAALSKWGFRIVHIDQNSYYGGGEASLTLEEFANWVDAHSTSSQRYSNATRSDPVPAFARQYSICLCPTINPSLGPFIDALIHSGVSKYSGFRLLERVAVYDGANAFKSVPGSKEDVFRNKDISLIQKRRLMRFLTFAAGDFEQSTELQGKHNLPFTDFLESVFSLSKELVAVIAYALAYSSSTTDPTISVLPRIKRYLCSVGRYGSSPFLVGHYGGVGEISQGFCRTAAVNGAVYILGRHITSISTNTDRVQSENPTPQTDVATRPLRYSVVLEDIPEPLHANVILGPVAYVPPQIDSHSLRAVKPSSFQTAYSMKSVLRCVAIVEHPIELRTPSHNPKRKEVNITDKNLDTAVMVFPPGSLDNGSSDSSVVVLMTGEGTLSAPKGKFILYISLPVSNGTDLDPSQALRPYLDAILELGREEVREPLFTAFYTENLGEVPPNDGSQSQKKATWLVPPPVPLGPLGDVADTATRNAETLFHEVLQALSDNGEKYSKDDAQSGGIWPKTAVTENEDEE